MITSIVLFKLIHHILGSIRDTYPINSKPRWLHCSVTHRVSFVFFSIFTLYLLILAYMWLGAVHISWSSHLNRMASNGFHYLSKKMKKFPKIQHSSLSLKRKKREIIMWEWDVCENAGWIHFLLTQFWRELFNLFCFFRIFLMRIANLFIPYINSPISKAFENNMNRQTFSWRH